MLNKCPIFAGELPLKTAKRRVEGGEGGERGRGTCGWMGVLTRKSGDTLSRLAKRATTSSSLSADACYCSKLTSPCDNCNFTNTSCNFS